MIAAMRAAGQPDPVIENFSESLFVTLHAASASAPAAATAPPPPAPTTLPAPTAAPPPLPPPPAALNLRESRLLAYLRDKGAITRVEYESYFSVGTRTAKRDLKHLQDLGLSPIAAAARPAIMCWPKGSWGLGVGVGDGDRMVP
jgi:hypothetical protein